MYPNLKGLWGISSVAFPGAAEAVKQAGRLGEKEIRGDNVLLEKIMVFTAENIDRYDF